MKIIIFKSNTKPLIKIFQMKTNILIEKKKLQFRIVSLVTRNTVILWTCSSHSPPCARLPACPVLLRLGLLLGLLPPLKQWIMKHYGMCRPRQMHSWKRTGSRATTQFQWSHLAKYVRRNRFSITFYSINLFGFLGNKYLSLVPYRQLEDK